MSVLPVFLFWLFRLFINDVPPSLLGHLRIFGSFVMIFVFHFDIVVATGKISKVLDIGDEFLRLGKMRWWMMSEYHVELCVRFLLSNQSDSFLKLADLIFKQGMRTLLLMIS